MLSIWVYSQQKIEIKILETNARILQVQFNKDNFTTSSNWGMLNLIYLL